MIQQQGTFFRLETFHTSCCFQATAQGFLQRLYYGKRLDLRGGYAALIPQVLHGIQPEGFSWCLEPGESFTAPEAAMAWGWGLARLSGRLHDFIRRHVLRGWWKDRPRPVLVNSWESFYFRFIQKDLLRLARQGRDAGAERFVLDDGWFGKRDNDACSLGDWTAVNRKKLPDGLGTLSAQERTQVAGQIAFYKKYRETLRFGQLYRLRQGDVWQMMAVSRDRRTALALLLQPENRANAPALRLEARGLEPAAVYRVRVRPAPTPLRAVAAKLVEIPGEEDILASGDLLTTHGAWLRQGFSGAGCGRDTRIMGDCGSRLYMLEQEE